MIAGNCGDNNIIISDLNVTHGVGHSVEDLYCVFLCCNNSDIDSNKRLTL